MTTPTLQDLLTPLDQPTIEQMLLAALQAAPIVGGTVNSFPVTDWAPGGFERTMIKMIATGLVSRENLIPLLTAGGFLTLASQITDASGNLVDGWLELLAAQNYNNPRGAATFTQQRLVLTCTTGPGPYSRNDGEIVAYSPSTGNRYRNVGSVTIPDGGSVTATFQSESPGLGYNDASGTIIGLITPMPGVSVTNPVTVAGVPTSTLTGTGTIAVSSTTITTHPRSVKLTFTTGGRLDDASARATSTVYEGTAVAVSGPFVAGSTCTLDDLVLTLADGPAGTQSFNTGDTWLVGIPGTPLLQAGADKESLAALAQGCSNQWPALADIPTTGKFEAWVFACAKAQGLGITKCKTAPSTTVAGIENVYIAGSTATATPDQVTAEQSYIDERMDLIGGAEVIAATAHPLVLGGTAQCRRGTTAAVKAAADMAWAAYIAGAPIGGEPPDSLIEIARLEQILVDAGAHNVSGLTFGGVAADVVLTAQECATVAYPPSTSADLHWQEVA